MVNTNMLESKDTLNMKIENQIPNQSYLLQKKGEENQEDEEEQQKSRGGGGGCSGSSGGAGDGDESSSMSCNCHKSPETPKLKLEIEENELPENWWDRLPDFDPRVFDAILMEQASACVNYIFNDLPDMHDLENQIEANKNPKTCPRLKTQVPRTKVIKPLETVYNIPIDSFINADETY